MHKFIYNLIFMLSMFLITFYFSIGINFNFEYLNDIDKKDYVVVYEYSNDVHVNNSYYKANINYEFKDNSDNINMDIYMQHDFNSNLKDDFLYKEKLLDNEVVINEIIADKYNINIGNQIVLYNYLTSKNEKFIVKDVIKDKYCYHQYVNDYIGYIILAFNEDLTSKIELDSLVFANLEFDPAEANLLLSDSYLKDNVSKASNYNMNKSTCLLTLIIFTFMCGMICIPFIFIKSRIKKNIILGLDIREVIKNVFLQTSLIPTLFIIILLGTFMTLTIIFWEIINLIYLWILLIILLAILIENIIFNVNVLRRA